MADEQLQSIGSRFRRRRDEDASIASLIASSADDPIAQSVRQGVDKSVAAARLFRDSTVGTLPIIGGAAMGAASALPELHTTSPGVAALAGTEPRSTEQMLAGAGEAFGAGFDAFPGAQKSAAALDNTINMALEAGLSDEEIILLDLLNPATPPGAGAMVGPLFHGGAKRFGKFSREFIGTGEGAQAFGFGHYFAENPGVAKGYRTTATQLDQNTFRVPGDVSATGRVDITVSGKPAKFENPDTGTVIGQFNGDLKAAEDFAFDNASKAGHVNRHNEWIATGQEIEGLRKSRKAVKVTPHEGALFETRIDVEPEDLLDWDKPLSEQSPKVKAALEKAGISQPVQFDVTVAVGKKETFKPTGQTLYDDLMTRIGSNEGASAALAEAGIPGIRYLDQGSRAQFRLRSFDSDGKQLRNFGAMSKEEAESLASKHPHLRHEIVKVSESEQTRNIVVFPDAEDRITITKINGEPVPDLD